MSIAILLAVVGLIICVQYFVYRRYWNDGISVDVGFDTPVAAQGETVNLCETVTHKGRLFLPWLLVKFRVSRELELPDSPNATVTDHYNREDVFRIRRGQRIIRRLPTLCTKRGYWCAKGIDLISTDFFYLSKLISNEGGSSTLTVLPGTVDADEIISRARQLMGETVVMRAHNEDPFVFRGIREYIPGDRLGHINWRASARSESLLVNSYEYTASVRICVVLDIPDNLEHIDYPLMEENIRIAWTIVRCMIDSGIPVALCCGARDIISGSSISTGCGCSREHMDTIGSALARIDLDAQAENSGDVISRVLGEYAENDFIICISSDTGHSGEEKAARLGSSRCEYLWVTSLRRTDDENADAQDEMPLPFSISEENCIVRRCLCD